MQLGRALSGEPQLLEARAPEAEGEMARKVSTEVAHRAAQERPLQDVPLRELFNELLSQSRALVKKEVELARQEARHDLKQEIKAAKGLGAAAVCALAALCLLLTAGALALVPWLPPWGAVLLVAALVIVAGTIAGLVGWSRRVRKPLERTRRTLEDDVQWAKERLA
jgi:Flp pilus assembly protein TadB